MKKLIATALFALAFTGAFAQHPPDLKKRLAEFMQIDWTSQVEKAMDYTYPKLFTIFPKEQLVEEFKKTFDNDEVKIRIDSTRIDSLYPVFQLDSGSFAKATYSMKMHLQLKVEDTTKVAEMTEMVASALSGEHGTENISSDKRTGKISIRMRSSMVAVKDRYAKEWCFANFKPEDPLMEQLFSQEVIDKLATYK